ncbi:putative ssDNA-binding protein [Heterostelium album PN500]|uniref:Putative ssDNA-binding protein n=1 Tax=Heterostelium pallidum (strain ATCC 26659 / Pp 5 / PN500) TaxID=670386 RepID=D3AZR0_HETP5|nr:putative ssDNA-binding protein [Heterostelium album PN500]EFA84534.1 putative ssDNA-binding protein [Heterostelium album PN500]|eukprot:XP_020436647.1 putative ssDNA-binding protein [Heterostelium album PN500]
MNMPIPNCITEYVNQNNINKEFSPSNVILQIKKITVKPERVELLLSDTANIFPFYVQTQNVDPNLREFTIIKVNQFKIVKSLYFQILSYTVIGHTGSLFGNAVSLHPAYQKQQQQQSALQTNNNNNNNKNMNNNNNNNNNYMANKQSNQSRGSNAGTSSPPTGSMDTMITQIKNISNGISNPTIRATVRAKSTIKQWHNSNSGGSILNLELIDDSDEKNEIKVTIFGRNNENNLCVQIDEAIHVGSTYDFSNFKINPKNPNFNKLSHPCELTFTENTKYYVSSAPINAHTLYNFVKIADLTPPAANETNSPPIDLFGYVSNVSGTTSINRKATSNTDNANSTLLKCTFRILDTSAKSIDVTAFGQQAETISKQLNKGNIIAIKSAKISSFSKCSASITYSSTYEVNPPQLQQECQNLLMWVNSHGDDAECLSESYVAGGNSDDKDSIRCTVEVLPQLNLGNDPILTKNYVVVGTLSTLSNVSLTSNDQKSQYTGCSACKKKNCNCGQPQIKYYRATFRLQDETGSVLVDAFSGTVEKMLGANAERFFDQLTDEDRLQRVNEICSVPYLVRLRVTFPPPSSDNTYPPKWSVKSLEEYKGEPFNQCLTNLYSCGTLGYNCNILQQQQQQQQDPEQAME